MLSVSRLAQKLYFSVNVSRVLPISGLIHCACVCLCYSAQPVLFRDFQKEKINWV